MDNQHEGDTPRRTRRGFLKCSAGLVGLGAVSLVAGCPESEQAPPATGSSAPPPTTKATPAPAPAGESAGKVGKNRFEPHTGPDGCELVEAKGAERIPTVKAAIEAYGGIAAFVKSGDRVVIKPNLAWAQPPEIPANAHPEVIRAVIELCKGAGAKEIIVGEHPRDGWEAVEALSGVPEVCKATGASLVCWLDQRLYRGVNFPRAQNLKSDDVATDLLDCDVLINIAKFKHHSASEVSGGMKNLMGTVLRPQKYHQTTDTTAKDPNLHVNLADLCTAVRPTLNVLDLTNTLLTEGPKGTPGAKIKDFQTILVSTDIVACDARGTQILGICTIDQAAHIRIAGEERGLGKVKDWKIKTVAV